MAPSSRHRRCGLAVALGDALRRSVDEIAVIGGAEIFSAMAAVAPTAWKSPKCTRAGGRTHFPPSTRQSGEEVAACGIRRSRRQRRLLLCDICRARGQLTRSQFYIDFFVREHKLEGQPACVVRAWPSPITHPDREDGAIFSPARGESSMPWSNQGGGPWGSGPKGPWGSGPQSRPNAARSGGNSAPRPGQPPALHAGRQSRRHRLRAAGARRAGALGLFRFLPGEPDELGVVLRFGKDVREVQPGLNYHLPYPIETVLTAEGVARQQDRYRHAPDRGSARRGATMRDVPEESLMLTGDENIVDVDFTVLWRVSPTASATILFNIQNPEGTVKAVAESAMREVIGRSHIQPILTGARKPPNRACRS